MRYASQTFSSRYRILTRTLAGLCLLLTIASCQRKPIATRDKLQWAFAREESDPESLYLVLTQDLPGNQDPRVVDALLDYLKDRSNSRDVNFDNVALVVNYMERISGIDSRIERTPSGPVYPDPADMDKDISRYLDWWAANKDHIVWNDAEQSLRVMPSSK